MATAAIVSPPMSSTMPNTTTTASAASASATASPPSAVVSEADVILPPPSTLNPIPSLPAALRLDNREQLLNALILQSPSSSSSSSLPSLRQLLVFEDTALRNLLLRQVLYDPQQAAAKNKQANNANKKKNWEPFNHFIFPKPLAGTIVATKLLTKDTPHSIFTPTNPSNTTTTTNNNNNNNANMALEQDLLTDNINIHQHIDVVTYFIRPTNLEHTQLVIQRIQQWNSSKQKKGMSSTYNSTNTTATTGPLHRVIYIPQPTALIYQLWNDTGLISGTSTGTTTSSTSSTSSSLNISIQSLQLDLFPLESDVISMEYTAAIREAFLEGTPSTLVTTCARALLKLQDITGPIPRIQTLGPLGEDVLTKACNMAVDDYLSQGDDTTPTTTTTTNTTITVPTNSAMAPSPSLSMEDGTPTKIPSNHLAMIIMDRKVDMVTPMVTPLTYEGLLDQIVGIDCGFIQVPSSTLNPEDDEEVNVSNAMDKNKKQSKQQQQQQQQQQLPVVLGVHAGDTLYAEVRDQHVEKFGSFLQNQAKALQESHANFTSKGTKKDLSEIHQFVKQIPMFTQNLRSLTNHIHLAELIKAHTEQISFREQWQTERSMIEGEICYDVLEEWICCQHPPDKVLRALCLQSLCSGGLKASRYDALRALIVQCYGYEYLLKLHDLEVLGWIRRKDTLWMDSASSAFHLLRKSLILIHAEVDTVEPDDVAYVSSGYAPLTVRLVQSAVQGWTKSKADVLKELPGRLVDIEQCWPPQDLASILQQQTPPTGGSLGDYAKKSNSGNSRFKPTLIVVYCGGITYMEIAALRFLSKRPSFPYNIVMVTTKIINGSSLLHQTLG